MCGYLFAQNPDEIEIAAWRVEVVQFCRENGFRLRSMFIDRGSTGDEVRRPGLSGLLDVLRLPDTHGVVVPHPEHLSADDEKLDSLCEAIRRTGSKVIYMNRDGG